MVSGRGRTDGMTAVQRAVTAAYAKAAVGPRDLDLVELHDATAIGELETYSDIGLCEAGDEQRLLDSGEACLGGRRPVNPSGGLIARGHPIGATGIAQIVEVTNQLRGRCGTRQVESARIGLTQNVGGFLGDDVASATAHIFERLDHWDVTISGAEAAAKPPPTEALNPFTNGSTVVQIASVSEGDRARSAHDGDEMKEGDGTLVELPALTSDNDEKCSGGETRTHNLADALEQDKYQHPLE
jgi:hypothetical protein